MIDLPPTPQEIEERRKERVAPWHLTAGLGPSAALDSSPALSLGAHGFVVLTAGRFWPVVADALFWVEGESGPDGRSFWIGRTMLGLGVCPLTLRGERLGLDACLGPQAELVSGWGAGFARNRGGLGVTIGGLAQAKGSYLLGEGVRAFGTLGIAATPQRIDFTFLDERGVDRFLHRTSPVSAVASFGVALDFF
jgi:hypothetical protein